MLLLEDTLRPSEELQEQPSEQLELPAQAASAVPAVPVALEPAAQEQAILPTDMDREEAELEDPDR